MAYEDVLGSSGGREAVPMEWSVYRGILIFKEKTLLLNFNDTVVPQNELPLTHFVITILLI